MNTLIFKLNSKEFTMRNIIATSLMIVGGFLSGQLAGADESIALIPQPLRMERKAGEFVLKSNTAILVAQDSPDAANVGKLLADSIRHSTGFNLKPTSFHGNVATRNAILLTTKNANTALNAEGYTLDVTTDGVTIIGDGPGLFYGSQTLLQLLPPQVFSPAKAAEPVVWAVPAVRIEDQPRFRWRGLLLDVARHFFNKEEIKNFLDLMAQHKLNTLQLHLTDDQGWRIEIKHYPKLTQIGAWRKDIGFGLNPKDGMAYGSDGRYGGFYTQDDIREIVAYAKDRYITVVPEIEMPGHASAALMAYPEFSCTGGPYTTDLSAGIFAGVYCVGNDSTFEFLENVLSEVIALFPSTQIHIGGDEVPKDNWKQCEKCQARIRRESLKNEDELQSYFVRRIEKYLNAHNRVLVGWDEILEGGLPPNAIVMSWRGINGGVTAANAGHDVVMTPVSHCYFDHSQEAKSLPLEKVYAFEPVPAVISADKAKHILGACGNLWSEYLPNYDHVQYMAYPRTCALAEVTWTDPKQKEWGDFRSRLNTHLQRLKLQGVNYRQPRENR